MNRIIWLIVFFLFLLSVFVISLLLRRKKKILLRKEDMKKKKKKTAICPLCGTLLPEGVRIRSVAYPGVGGKIVHVYGCPFCYPDQYDTDRTCPVCRNSLPADAYLIGRMMEYTERNHLHISGCTVCLVKR